jgi:hypothetical protein
VLLLLLCCCCILLILRLPQQQLQGALDAFADFTWQR